jgi:NADH-quinone oxidoreductase subunit L
LPLFVLAIGSIFTGILGAKFFHMVSHEDNFFNNVIILLGQRQDLLEEIHHAPFLVKISPLIVGVSGIILAALFYLIKTDLPKKLADALQPFYKLSLNKWYFDEIYEKTLIQPIKKLGDFLWKIIDMKIVDGVPNGAVALCKIASQKISKLQTGYIYSYSLWMILGLIAIVFFLINSLKQILVF